MKISKGMLTVNALLVVLSFLIYSNTALASTYFEGSVNVPIQSDGNFSAIFYNSGATVMPSSSEDIIESTDSNGNTYTSRRLYNYDYEANTQIVLSGNIYQSDSVTVTEGYLNGVLTVNTSFTFTFNNAAGVTQFANAEGSAVLDGNNSDNLRATITSGFFQNNQLNMNISVVFNNYPVSSGSSINIGNIRWHVQRRVNLTNTSTPNELLTMRCSGSLGSSTLKASVLASSNTSIAGQVYSAIENSIQVSDIVNYLSIIEDASGDINTAVSHIDRTLIPQVIQHLINISTNTGVMRVDLDEVVRLLTAFMNTWPEYESQVLFYLNQLVNMNAEQSSAAAAVEQEYNQKASAGADLNEGMQVVIPSVDQEIFDIDSGVDAPTMQTLSAFWSMFTGNTIIQTMFVIAIAGIAAGFLLYGKKGG